MADYQRRKRQEAYWRQAKLEGYRARSAFKLKQILARFRVLADGGVVVDLGCAPGGWTQVLVEHVGPAGAVVGVDLDRTPALEGAVVIRGDATTVEVQQEVRDALDSRPVDAVVSDMSPSISGQYSRDQAQSAWLATQALQIARQLLRPGGGFVCKVFEGEDMAALLEDVARSFARVRRFSPPASRKSSSEVYVVGMRFRPKAQD